MSSHHPPRPTPSSSDTSARLTPNSDDSDSNDDHEIFVEDGAGPLSRGRGGSSDNGYEMTEMDWDGEKRHQRRDGRLDKATEDEGFRARQQRKSGPRKDYYTTEEEQAVVRKFDRRLVVFVALLYMLSFLDRSNIGNARIAGMDDDLQSIPRREEWYEWALTAFYISYIVFEWMSLLWKLIPAHIYVSMLVLSWGVVASLQAVTVNYPMLIFLRTLLGIGEAGFTGIPFYLSFFFKRHELAFRTAIFISAAPLATSFASSLAWLIIKVGEAGPIAPWRLLFLIEGFPSVLIAVIAWNVIPDTPQTASYLTQREKKVARLRLGNERPRRKGGEKGSGASADRLKTRDVLAVFRDPVAWITASMFFLTNMAYSSLPVFLPTILKEMGHDVLTAQALAAPPYLAAFVIVLATAHLSDMLRARTPLIVFHALASAGGYGVLALSRSLGLEAGSMIRYLAVYPAAIGFFNVVVLTIAWSINNQEGASRQGGGFALLQVVGQCGPLVGTHLYPDRDRPFYESGMRACAVAMLIVACLALVLRFYLVRSNRKLDAAVEVDGEERAEQEGLVAGSGTAPRHTGESFRFML
ncbi:putative major facilitator superfamily transporter protein [Phaeoacremonium minimum UCRPA7]|uniref:Putative major facilitator superfamily transporter protein n=1 Tax=Phaeoacremonium minimum (strain UCR-PA7) TaxID=1286976 RepID=R8BE99_PHAM7|nr:putative major facilitator superfamily transporter protein [Phaeoacremonium minimum UCRPA7]EON97631.1 putative major facilitator superfamily transporter protein [Phaeoacremonium minimum UCRPA7]